METFIGVILLLVIVGFVGWKILKDKNPELADKIEDKVEAKADELKAKAKDKLQ